MQKIKYITNRDLLAEIQRSKATYCHFISPEYMFYDAVVTNAELLTPEFIQAARHTKQAKLAKAQLVEPVSSDVVFRVMTDTHLPEELDEKRRKRSSTGGWVPRTNFPPFQHFALADDVLVEVGRSHWKDDLETGRFCTTHGKMTNRLASMLLMLVEQYSRRGNWRGYCLPEGDEALTQRGWLGIDEINETDIILSYHDGALKWSKIKSIYRGDYTGKMFHLSMRGLDAMVTPGHKFVTQDGLKAVELLRETDKLVLIGSAVEDGLATYEDAFVELVGWFVTEGNLYFEEGRNYGRVTLYQNEGLLADRIRSCIKRLDEQHSEFHRLCRRSGKETQVAFHLRKALCQRLLDVAPGRVPSMPFILSLSQRQRELLINTMIDGDGCRTKPNPEHGCKGGHRTYAQKDAKQVDAFVALCTMAGYRTRTRPIEAVSFGKPTQYYLVSIYSDRFNHAVVGQIDLHEGKRNGRTGRIGHGKAAHPNEPTVEYSGRVWCVETEYGSFMARRDGTIFLSGNSYVSEMRGQALVQLAQVSLQFDESRSDNPFAWYTQIVKNSFRRILLLEKRNQDIRDDLLVMHGAMPSFTRQVDDELEQRSDKEGEPETKEPKRRGRKPKGQD